MSNHRPWFTMLLVMVLAAAASAGEGVLSRLQEEIRGLARDARPAVVKVKAEREPVPGEPLDEAATDLGIPLPEVLRRSRTVGTGFLISPDGLILTTHRIAAAASEAQVEFPDGTLRRAEVLGSDAFFQVALLKVEPVEGVKPLSLSTDEESVPGSLGLFIGNSFGISGNMSLGIITASGVRGGPFDEYDNYLVMNAPIQPGDAGGAFLDPEGRVLGMGVGSRGSVTRLVRAGKGGGVIVAAGLASSGMGYLVSAADIRFAVEEIRAHGHVRRGRLGVLVNLSNLEIRKVIPGTPAEEAGLRQGDIFVAQGDRALACDADLRFFLRRVRVGATVSIRVRRGEDEISYECRVGRTPARFSRLLPCLKLVGLGSDEEKRLVVGRLDGEFATTGIRVGDVVHEVDGRPVGGDMRFLLNVLGGMTSSDTIRLRLLRGDERIEVVLPR